MKINVNHPSFISFIDEVTTTILKSISIDNYFNLSNESKVGVQHIAYKFIYNAIRTRIDVDDEEIKTFINILWKKNVDNEMYEFAAVLKDIVENFEKVKIETKKNTPKTGSKKTIRVKKE